MRSVDGRTAPARQHGSITSITATASPTSHHEPSITAAPHNGMHTRFDRNQRCHNPRVQASHHKLRQNTHKIAHASQSSTGVPRTLAALPGA